MATMAAEVVQKSKTYDWTQPPVAIKVTNEGNVLWLNAASLARNSKYFRKALSDKWWSQISAKPFNFTQNDIKLETFNYYGNWCLYNDLACLIDSLDESLTDDYQRCGVLYQKLVDLYVLGNYLEDMTLRNSIMDKIIYLVGAYACGPEEAVINTAFEKLSEHSTMCRFLVALALSGTCKDWLGHHHDTLHPDYLKALLFGWANASQDSKILLESPVTVAKTAPCTFHEHDESVPRKGMCMLQLESGDKEVPQTPGPKAKKRRL